MTGSFSLSYSSIQRRDIYNLPFPSSPPHYKPRRAVITRGFNQHSERVETGERAETRTLNAESEKIRAGIFREPRDRCAAPGLALPEAVRLHSSIRVAQCRNKRFAIGSVDTSISSLFLNSKLTLFLVNVLLILN